jgi:hypothetical protein
MNYILRAVFNRPEMLYLSIAAEIEARSYYSKEKYKTLFCVEHGAPFKVLDIINTIYPFDMEIIKRPFRHMGWGNILEGFKVAFNATDDYVINIEDDGIVHKTFFEYMEKAHELTNPYTVINASNRTTPNRSNSEKVNIIRYGNSFEANGCLISKYFFKVYIEPYATYEYYKNRGPTIARINQRNGDVPQAKYRKSNRNSMKHVGWDGLVNRLVDTAIIEEQLYSVSPFADRLRNIGFYGQNRPGTFPLKSDNFEERVTWLSQVSNNKENLKKLDRFYSDYTEFYPELNDWSGNLFVEGNNE